MNSNRKKNTYNNSTYSLLNRTGSYVKWKDKIIEKDREEAIDNENNIEYDNEEVFNYFLKDNSDFTNKSST